MKFVLLLIYVKTKMLVDFDNCIRVPLSIHLTFLTKSKQKPFNKNGVTFLKKGALTLNRSIKTIKICSLNIHPLTLS